MTNLLEQQKMCDIYICVHDTFYMTEMVDNFVNFLYILADLEVNIIRLCVNYDRADIFKDVFKFQQKFLPQLLLKCENRDLELNEGDTVKNYTIIITDNTFNIFYPNRPVAEKYINICKMFKTFYDKV